MPPCTVHIPAEIYIMSCLKGKCTKMELICAVGCGV